MLCDLRVPVDLKESSNNMSKADGGVLISGSFFQTPKLLTIVEHKGKAQLSRIIFKINEFFVVRCFHLNVFRSGSKGKSVSLHASRGTCGSKS
jgi:hypothetical protein